MYCIKTNCAQSDRVENILFLMLRQHFFNRINFVLDCFSFTRSLKPFPHFFSFIAPNLENVLELERDKVQHNTNLELPFYYLCVRFEPFNILLFFSQFVFIMPFVCLGFNTSLKGACYFLLKQNVNSFTRINEKVSTFICPCCRA